MLRVFVEGVDVRGPGLQNWAVSQPILTGAEPYHPSPIILEPPVQLSAAERRRAISTVKLAFAVGIGAVEQSGHDPAALPAVFASSGADGLTNSSILLELLTPGREVSPTRFHNSVHNAPSGYWSIGVQSREAVTSLSAHDSSFSAGLLEAGVQAVSGARPVLLIAYDIPYPEPLHSVRPIESSFGTALVLAAEPSGRAVAELMLRMAAGAKAEASGCADHALEKLRRGNPAARSLPLLALLAARAKGSVRLDYGQGGLEIEIVPC